MKKSFALKLLALMMALLMTLMVFTACGGNENGGNGGNTPAGDAGNNGTQAPGAQNPGTQNPGTQDPGTQNPTPGGDNGGSNTKPVPTDNAELAKAIIEGFVEDLALREELSYLAGVFTEGSLAFSAEGKGSGEALLESGKIGGKLYFGNGLLVDDLTFKWDDIDVTADLYMGKDMIYLSNDSILGGTYGVIKGEMADAFKDSFFVTDPDFGFEEETYEQIVSILEYFDTKEPTTLNEKGMKVLEKYRNAIIDSVFKHATYALKDVTVTMGNETVNGRELTVSFNLQSARNIIADLKNLIDTDTELKAFFEEALEQAKGLLVVQGNIDADVNADELYNELKGAMADALAELDSQLAGATAAEKASTIHVRLVTPKDSVTLVQFAMGGTGELAPSATKADAFTLDLGAKGIKETSRIFVHDILNSDYDFELLINQNGSSYGIKAQLVEAGDDTVVLFDLKLNNDAHTCEIAIPAADLTISGTYAVDGDKVTLKINKIVYVDEAVQNFEITLTLDKKDAMPTLKTKDEVTNLFDMTKGQLVDIMDRAQDVLGPFMGSSDPQTGITTGVPINDIMFAQ